MTSILYSDLITLISTSSLVPEEQYRITDYVTTVSKANYSSAGYKFDIVVTALTTNTLYEYATLMANATEIYFDADALLLYNVKYSVTNQVPGYYNDWVDVSGKGVIYYMVDAKGNEAPFDFKNIKYNGHFLYNSNIDNTDTSQSVSEYNSVKEVIEDDTFFIPQVGFNDECHNVSIDINAAQVSVTECSNLQIGKSCSNCEFSEVSNFVIGNDFVNSELTFINGGEIGNNNNGITATNQTNLIVGINNTSVTLGGGGNGVIIDSNNHIITVGNYAKDVYINASKTVNLGNNTEQFNISSSYDLTTASDCKLFTLNETNHLTATTGCESINTTKNSYLTLTEAIKNVTVGEGLSNLTLDGTKLVGEEAKTIVLYNTKMIVIDDVTSNEVVIDESGDITQNTTVPTFYEKYKLITSPVNIQISKEYKLYKYVHTTGNITLVSFSSDLLSDLNNTTDVYTFEMEITMPFGYSSVNFASNISKLSEKNIILAADKKNYLTFRTFDGTNFIVNYQGYI